MDVARLQNLEDAVAADPLDLDRLHELVAVRHAVGYTAVAFDFETWPIHDGLLAPRPVCGSWACGEQSGVVLGHELVAHLRDWLYRPGVVLVAQNAPFDLAVACAFDPALVDLVFRAVAVGRVRDTAIRQKLINLAHGCHDLHPATRRPQKYSLAALVDWHFGVDISSSKAADSWRLRYLELEGVPVAEYPRDAYDYALLDSVYALAVHDRQVGDGDPWSLGDPLAVRDEVRQLRTAFALHLGNCWGLRTAGDAVAELEASLRAQREQHKARLQAAGLVRANGSRDMKAIRATVEAAYGGDPPSTPTGAASTSGDALRESSDELLHLLADYQDAALALSGIIPRIRLGAQWPITPSVDVVKATGRVSYYDPALQNWQTAGGYRETVRARPGSAIVTADYKQCELVCLAQICLVLFGFSRMAEEIRKGADLHNIMGAEMLEMPIDAFDRASPEHESARQDGKAGNFGYPGGMGPAKFVATERKKGFRTMDLDLAKRIKKAWLAAWPEMRLYLDYIGELCERYGGRVVQIRSERVRAACRYTQAANSFFQGLAADVIADAVWLCSSACYSGRSPLFGSRLLLQVHDELVFEVPVSRVDDAAREIEALMLRAGRIWCPDVPHTVDIAAADRWSKKAEAVRDDRGALAVWSPAL